MNSEEQKSIEATKREFEKSFEENSYYNKQTKDEEHLAKLLAFMDFKEGMTILDLGTGTGFLAFEIAKRCKNAKVIGLDIVEDTLNRNRERAKSENIENVEFITYDGSEFPLNNQSVDLVVSRYVIHHFPNLEEAAKEIKRVLKEGARVVISDPTPNEEDTNRFVDAYMQMKKDGHIKFYRKQELIDIMKPQNILYVKDFVSSIRFPRKRKTAIEFDQIMKEYDQNVIESYDVEVTEDEIYITEKVLNIMFEYKGES